MTSETDEEFVERMEHDWVHDIIPNSDDADRLFTLARRGAAMADQERKQRAIMGDPLKGFTLPPPPAGEQEHE